MTLMNYLSRTWIARYLAIGTALVVLYFITLFLVFTFRFDAGNLGFALVVVLGGLGGLYAFLQVTHPLHRLW